MKLHYFRARYGNFGDDINPWLWKHLLPDFFDDDPSELFIGIGTLLNHRLPDEPIKHVFGAGHGYGELPRNLDRFIFHAVRGYATARALGIDEKLVITDSAILLRTRPFERAERPIYSAGFIPHCQSSEYFDWEALCKDIGVKYISAEWDVEKVLFEMTQCETLLCEAMHGAIAADTLRIPWIPVSCYDYISAYKWQDWLSTLKLPYTPARITSLYDIERDSPLKPRLKNHLKRSLRATGIWSENWMPPPPSKTGRKEYDRAAAELTNALQNRSYLSEDALLDQHTDRYLELVEALKQRR